MSSELAIAGMAPGGIGLVISGFMVCKPAITEGEGGEGAARTRFEKRVGIWLRELQARLTTCQYCGDEGAVFDCSVRPVLRSDSVYREGRFGGINDAEHGYATEAARAVVEAAAATGRRRLWSTVGTWNTPSLRVLDKLGFERDHVSAGHGGDLVWLTRSLP